MSLIMLSLTLSRPLFLSLSLCLSHHLVSFKIYDLDGDGVISTKDLTKVVADTMREQDVVIHKGTYIPWTLDLAVFGETRNLNKYRINVKFSK